ncbi:MAG: XRE family transcriptional regulator [Candidatus Zixiibacteriota bacterium]|nr:MAG: XRE family transcriptional regulator [candidate division Zixibacteria bacterium]
MLSGRPSYFHWGYWVAAGPPVPDSGGFVTYRYCLMDGLTYEADVLLSLEMARVNRGLSMSELSRRAGITLVAYKNYVNGRQSPTLRVLSRLCRELDLRVSLERR